MGEEKATDAPKTPKFNDLELDRRQLRLFDRVIRDYVKKTPSLASLAEPTGNRTYWDVLPDEHKSILLNFFYILDQKEAPKYRRIGQRFQQVRKDRNLSVADFAKQLCSPLGADPFPDKDIKFTTSRVRDLEYGNLKFGEEIATLVFDRFGVSGEWLLEGRGSPHTRTDTFTMPRLVALEARVSNLEDHHNELVGSDLMNALNERGHKLIERKPEGNLRVVGGTNIELRVELTQTMELVEQLKARLDVQQDLLSAYKTELGRLKALTIVGL